MNILNSSSLYNNLIKIQSQLVYISVITQKGLTITCITIPQSSSCCIFKVTLGSGKLELRLGRAEGTLNPTLAHHFSALNSTPKWLPLPTGLQIFSCLLTRSIIY